MPNLSFICRFDFQVPWLRIGFPVRVMRSIFCRREAGTICASLGPLCRTCSSDHPLKPAKLQAAKCRQIRATLAPDAFYSTLSLEGKLEGATGVTLRFVEGTLVDVCNGGRLSIKRNIIVLTYVDCKRTRAHAHTYIYICGYIHINKYKYKCTYIYIHTFATPPPQVPRFGLGSDVL